MEIILDGVNELCRENVKNGIEEIYYMAFPNGCPELEAIVIPCDIVDFINSELRKQYEDIEYELPKYGDLAGKTFTYNGKCKVVLNSSFFTNGFIVVKSEDHDEKILEESMLKLQANTVYHELMHVKYYIEEYNTYNDYNDYEYKVDKIMFNQSRNLWDEYYAVKNSYKNFFDTSGMAHIDELFTILIEEYKKVNNEIILHIQNGDWKQVMNSAIAYVDELKRYLSIAFGIMDSVYESTKDKISKIDDAGRLTFIGDIFDEIHNLLIGVDKLPIERDILIMATSIKQIYDRLGIGWYICGDGYSVYLTKELSPM